MKLVYILLSSLLILSITACGGGGGGGGGSSTEGIRVLHGAIELSQVDAVSSLSETGEVFAVTAFGDNNGYQSVPQEEQVISITTHNKSGDVIASLNAPVAKRRTLMLYGTEATTGNRAVFFTDEVEEFTEGSGKIRLLHGVAAAAGLDLLVDGSVVSGGVGFGGTSGYLDISEGEHTIVVRRTADNLRLFSGTFTFTAKTAYTVFAGGEAEYYSFVQVLTDG
ncbi:MAG: DUF4397 domain-containing protein [Bdellovibrionota bacterium]